MKTFAVLGSGVVGETLSNGLLKHGYAVIRASRDPQKLDAWKQQAGHNAQTATPDAAAKAADAIVLAVKGEAAEAAVVEAGIANFAGKLVIDTTNPIASAPPQHGVLQYFTTMNESLMERLQKRAPDAHFVKAFNCVGNAFMVNPDFGGETPTMFICGDNSDAKKTVVTLLEQFGWDIEDLGAVEAARAIEPLCMLWCIPGMTQNRWSHAFRLLRK